jgi:hypothetical protein
MLMTAVEVDLISTCPILIFPDWVRIHVRAHNVSGRHSNAQALETLKDM